jgi:hypothetical protein
MAQVKQERSVTRDKTGNSPGTATLTPAGVPPVDEIADEDYPGGKLALPLWVGGFLILAGVLLWDFVAALLFR